MAGIAGYFGAGAQDIDGQSVIRSLAFTGREKTQLHRSPDFFAISVAHPSEASRSPRLVEAGGICLLVDGQVVDIDLGTGSLVDPSKAPAECARLLREEGVDFARRLNGSFSIAAHDSNQSALHLLADRFGSRPFFYVTGEGFLAFSSRVETFAHFGLDNANDIDIGGLAEVLVFGRSLIRNLWSGVETVPGGYVVTYREGGLKKNRYYQFKFCYEGEPVGTDDAADEMAHAFRRSVEKQLVGWERSGLLLSGGLDSRAVLACLPSSATCYTAYDRINNETRVAGKVAAASGNRHVLLKRNTDYYLDILPAAARISEGAFDYTHTHIEGLTDRIEESEDGVVFSGYNVDTYLKGLYLPQASIKFRDRNILLGRPKLQLAEGDLEDEMLSTLGHFGGGMTALEVLRGEVKAEVLDHPRRALRVFMEGNRDSVIRTVDHLELMGFMDNYKTFAYTINLSLRHRLAERSVCFDNDLLDVVLKTTPEQRFDALLFKKAITVLGDKYAAVRNANTLLPPGTPSVINAAGVMAVRTIHRLRLAAIRRLRPGVPTWTYSIDSWSDKSELWRCGPVAGYLEGLLSDPVATRDDLLDPASVRKMIELHRAGKGRYHHILPIVLTFLEWRKTTPSG